MFFDGNQLKPQGLKNLSVKTPKVSTKGDGKKVKDSVKYDLLYPDGAPVNKLREMIKSLCCTSTKENRFSALQFKLHSCIQISVSQIRDTC